MYRLLAVQDRLEAYEADPQQLWSIVDTLLGRGRIPASHAVDAQALSQFLARYHIADA